MFPITITHAIWIPVEIFFYVIIGYFSRRNNSTAGKKFLIIMSLLTIFPLWALIAPDSTNMAMDVLLYDTIMVLTLTASIIYFGRKTETAKRMWGIYNWCGLLLVIIGLILMKL